MDKLLHFAAGVGISLGCVIAFDEHGFTYGITASFAVGAGKELLWDLALNRGTPEFADFWFTLLGGITGALAGYAVLK